MLGHLYHHWAYTNAVVRTVQGLVDSGVISTGRANTIRMQLADHEHVAETVIQLESGQSGSAFLSLAAKFVQLFNIAAVKGDAGKGDYLKLAARALELEELSAADARAVLARMFSNVQPAAGAQALLAV